MREDDRLRIDVEKGRPKPLICCRSNAMRTVGYQSIRSQEHGSFRRSHRKCNHPLHVRRNVGVRPRQKDSHTALTQQVEPNYAVDELV